MNKQNMKIWFMKGQSIHTCTSFASLPHFNYLPFLRFNCSFISAKKFFPITFFGSILWIAAFSYLMVWWSTVTGNTVGIPPEVRKYWSEKNICYDYKTQSGDGINILGGGNLDPWSHHKCDCGEEGIWRHGRVQLRRQQHLRRDSRVSDNIPSWHVTMSRDDMEDSPVSSWILSMLIGTFGPWINTSVTARIQITETSSVREDPSLAWG